MRGKIRASPVFVDATDHFPIRDAKKLAEAQEKDHVRKSGPEAAEDVEI